MVKIFKNNLFWTVVLFITILVLSILSKWFIFLDLGIFNYSILFIVALLLPNLNKIYKDIKNSEIEIIKLPFCDLKLLKKYDYYFIGSRKENEFDEDLIALSFYKDIFNKKEALDKFNEEFPNQEEYEITEIVKQVHYKKNDQ